MARLKLGKYKIQDQGGAFRITLPKNVVESWNLKSGDSIFIYYENDIVLISKNELATQ
ncbi:MAG: AbrB/MazE/SpoVT family DNA-binding domain-containing protein [Candidatus Hermodarchaeota archaeon]